MFERIVVGYDGSDTSDNALRLACDLAQKYSSELHLVHTPQPQTVAFAMGAVAGYHAVTTMPSADEVKAANDKIIAQARAMAEGSGKGLDQTHIGQGEPADSIVSYAQDCGADLIVCGRRGLGALGALVQGSTSVRINHLAQCATLSVA